MAMKLGGDGDSFEENHDINVTPFIDVMLVLLIIFMVAAPLATVNVPLDLPVSSAEAKPPAQEPVILSIQEDLKWSLGEVEITPPQLRSVLDAETGQNRETRIFVRADKQITYDDLMNAMNALREAGYLKISLVGIQPADAGGE